LPADPFNVFDTERRRLVGVVVVVDMMVRSSRVPGGTDLGAARELRRLRRRRPASRRAQGHLYRITGGLSGNLTVS
jgi:hypothetical protein